MIFIFFGIETILFLIGVGIISWIVVTFLGLERSSGTFRRWVIFIGVVFSTLPLLGTKYFRLVDENKWTIVGVSFVTFEALSLVFDAYYRKGIFAGNTHGVCLITVLSYLAFFPTIVSGPILRFEDFNRGYEEFELAETGWRPLVERIMLGLIKKVLIADKLAAFANNYFDGISNGFEFSNIGLWLASIAYSLQLYYDFSGYSDMAIGFAGLMGINIPENFNSPYTASSISDFWRRWHISLSKWFKDYVYIPLGGNRKGFLIMLRNMVIVWGMTGLWHGKDVKFIVWGAGYCVLLILEKRNLLQKSIKQSWLRHFYTLFWVNLLWIPFRASSLGTACAFIKGMILPFRKVVIEKQAIYILPLLLISILLLIPWNKIVKSGSLNRVGNIIKPMVILLGFLYATASVINSTYVPYIYGEF